MSFVFKRIAFSLGIVFCAVSAQAELSLTQTASILAGKPFAAVVGSKAAAVQNSREFESAMADTTHPSAFRTWSTPDGQRLSHPGRGQSYGYNRLSVERRSALRAFSKHHLNGAYNNTKTVFYPFGGPDVIYPLVLLPNLKSLILVGLENPGFLPDVQDLLNDRDLHDKIQEIGSAYHSLFLRSYFVTDSMSRELKEFGTATMISVGIVLMGYELVSLEHIQLNSNGQVVQGNRSSNGIKIQYRRNRNEGLKSVYYFRGNLANGAYDGLAAFPGSKFEKFVNTQNVTTVLYKASMYLPHNSWTSAVNRFAASRKYILQSDTGLPLDYIDRSGAKIKLFGHYTKPDSDFGTNVQWDLRDAYGKAVCSAGGRGDQRVFNHIWGTSCRSFRNVRNSAQITWAGYMPWGGYDYATFYVGGKPLSTWGSWIAPNSSGSYERGRQAVSNFIYVENP